MDTDSFGRAMRRVLRQDPDVILIGEMRDEETVRTALSAAETGHLVLSTVHTLDAPETVNRIIDFFPPHEQNQARAMLAGTLKAIVSQRLVPTADGDGRVAVCEVLRMTGRARDMIIDPEQTGRLREVIVEGEYYGMQTFDQALLRHYQAGRVSMEDALRVASSPHDFKLLVAARAAPRPRWTTSQRRSTPGSVTPSRWRPPRPPRPQRRQRLRRRRCTRRRRFSTPAPWLRSARPTGGRPLRRRAWRPSARPAGPEGTSPPTPEGRSTLADGRLASSSPTG